MTQAQEIKPQSTKSNGGSERVSGYAQMSGYRMYYDVRGTGDPAVYIHPAWRHSGWDGRLLPKNRQWISVDLQGHGRSSDAELRAGPPAVPDRRRAGAGPDADSVQFQREQYSKVALDPKAWPVLFAKVFSMPSSGLTPETAKSLTMPVLLAVGDHDFVRLEHLLEWYRKLPSAQLSVIPDAGHFVLYERPDKLVSVVEQFLDAPLPGLPFTTPHSGFHPGVNR